MRYRFMYVGRHIDVVNDCRCQVNFTLVSLMMHVYFAGVISSSPQTQLNVQK